MSEVESGVFQKYPTQKAIAMQLIYGKKWKIGDAPKRINLGSLLFPIDASIEDASDLVRRQFPDANCARLYDETGLLFCSGSL